MGNMAMNLLTPEQVWSWIDEGRAQTELEKLRRNPQASKADIALLEDLLSMDRLLASQPAEEPSPDFDAAVLARIPGLSAPALPGPMPLLSGIAQKLLAGAFLLSLVLVYLVSVFSNPGGTTGLPSTYTQLAEPGLRFFQNILSAMPDLTGSWAITAMLILPALLLFWFMDRSLHNLWRRR